ncbi:uncharacterized protein LOC119503167 [Sebastes umbrosus]|uniref:uncharacterized protein LOC119503167 n=1 Tax=Sebastes umbrosus TaxID=72105 RepID=UPI00189D6F24|nr:uncharacterized protein LOC119503167 [Sebastes umbrosus]
MPDSCCAVGCTNRRGNKPGLCFYRIPSERDNLERRRWWISAIRRDSVPGESKQWQPSKYTRICNEHFINGAKSDDPLSPDWVPSVFSHTPATKKRKRERDMERYDHHSRMNNKRAEEKKKQEAVDVLLELSSVPEAEPAPPAEDEQRCDNRPCKEKTERLQRECNELREENERLKDTIRSGTFDELAFEEADEKVKAMTGIPTYSKLQVVLTFVMSFLQTGTDLSPFQQLLLTLMRLKMNLPLSFLGCIFKISIPTASRTFRNTIEVLNARLVPALVFWPNREELQLSMPTVFRQVFRKCACIIDCFEIFIEKPRDLRPRAQTYSKHKRHHTMKYLIGITPQGTVCFISKGWGGRTSDKHLTESTGFLDHLNLGDVILADRGFDVADSVGLYNAELKIPAFTKGEKQLGPVELESTRGLASVRIHVERVTGEARNRYTVLQSTFGIQMCEAEHPKGLTPLDKVVHVCCALTNLAPSVVRWNFLFPSMKQ